MKKLKLFSAALALLCATHLVIGADQQSDKLRTVEQLQQSIVETQSYIDARCRHSDYPKASIENQQTCNAASEQLAILHNLMYLNAKSLGFALEVRRESEEAEQAEKNGKVTLASMLNGHIGGGPNFELFKSLCQIIDTERKLKALEEKTEAPFRQHFADLAKKKKASLPVMDY